MTYVVGLTGGIACGKSSVSKILSEEGVPIIDADLISRYVFEHDDNIRAAITTKFKEHNIIDANGDLDRGALRKLVFSDDANREWLESIMIPAMVDQLNVQLAEHANSNYVVLDAALLFEKKLNLLCDCVILVHVSKDVQLERAMARDKNTKEQIEAIIKAQFSEKERMRFIKGNDIIIDNNNTQKELEAQVHKYHKALDARATVKNQR